ncbi:MAG: tripartite tricarboxylate transporter substrate binding protein [Betaproteobacteria bacterium]|nr:tripartite tricarboxylate transporter substrate binding protein [Betaproteobacteria bacterium]
MKNNLTKLAALLAAAALPTLAGAQAYPAKPIRMIVPFPPGGGVDFMGRNIGQKLGERLSQQIIIDNRAGSNGIIGLQALMAAAPDGYTIASASAGPLAVNPHVYSKLPYDTLRDFSIIARGVDFPLLLLTHPSLPAKNLKELIALARSRPGELAAASSGSGNSDHLALELFKSMAKLDFIHVPYKGAGPSTVALLSGEVQLMFASIPPTLQHVRAGKLRALGIGNAQRIPSQPDFPTIAEGGLPGYEAYSWGGVIGPAKMPAELVQRLNREINEVLKTRDVAERLLAGGTIPMPATPEAFVELIRAELQKWGAVARAAKIRAD